MRGLLTLLLFVTSAWSKAWYEKGSKHGIVEELGPLLSEYAKIVLPDDVRFKDASHRWQWWDAPDVKAVVEVQSEEDVRQTVCSFSSYPGFALQFQLISPKRNLDVFFLLFERAVPDRNRSSLQTSMMYHSLRGLEVTVPFLRSAK